MNANDIEAIGERFTRLEREVTLWKRAAAATIALLVALTAFSPTPRTREARAADSSAQDLVVRSLKIVDEQGKVRAGLAVTKDGPVLMLFDGKGSIATLSATKDGTGLDLADKEGSTNLGTRALLLYDEKGTTRAGLAVLNNSPALVLSDEKGMHRAFLAINKDVPVLALFDEKGTQRAKLATDDHGPVLVLLDENETLRATLKADKDASALYLLDKDEKPIWRAP